MIMNTPPKPDFDSFKNNQAIVDIVTETGTPVEQLYHNAFGISPEQEKPDSHNAILDTQEPLNEVDLLQFVDNDHLLKKLAIEVAAVFHLPKSTVFLMGLSVFSSVSCRNWLVNYPDNKNSLPIGLYTIAEQPSGVGKSRCLNVFQYPFFESHKSVVKDRQTKINRLLRDKEISGKLDEESTEELFDLQSIAIPQLYTTNATPEGLERTLAGNKGFFAAISSEQGLFNSLFGKTYSNGANNNDVVLNGFDGGFINVNRAGRDGYSGNVTGAVVCFAQQGSVETILDASNGTGLSERFLMLVEAHLLGKRNHKINGFINETLLIAYNNACAFALGTFTNPNEYNELSTLFISKAGFDLIDDYKNAIEPHLADGGKYSYPALRGVASKINMQIMKIAANLYLLTEDYRCTLSPNISDSCVKSAVRIADKLLQHQRKMLVDKGFIGLKAEYEAILDLFKDKPLGYELTYRQIQQAKKKVKPFFDMPKPTEAIREALIEIEKQGLLEKRTDGKMDIYRLGQ
jgi:hypothetical protein